MLLVQLQFRYKRTVFIIRRREMNAIYVAKVSKNSCVYCSQLKLTVIHFKFKDYNKEKIFHQSLWYSIDKVEK